METTASAGAWIEQAAQRLTAAGYQQVEPPPGVGSQVRVFRRRQFRVQWMFATMHSFVVLQPEGAVSLPFFGSFIRQVTDFAKRSKGGLPRGLQTGIGVFPVLVTDDVRPEVSAGASATPVREWGGVVTPIVVDVAARRGYTYAGRMLWGLIFMSYVAAQQRLILGDLDATTMRPVHKDPLALALVLLVLAMPLLGVVLVALT